MNPAPYSQVVVWPGTVLGETTGAEFEAWVLEELGTRAQYLKSVITNPNQNEFGQPMEDSGGREDILFAVHEDDIGKFAVPRFRFGMRWLDDVYENGHGHLYDDSVRALRSW